MDARRRDLINHYYANMLDALAVLGDPLTETPYVATLQHIRLLVDRRTRLMQAQRDAEEQIIHRLACDYEAGRLDLVGLYEAYQACKDAIDERIEFSTFGKRWNKRMPITSQSIGYQVQRRLRHAPHEDGTWRGSFPFVAGERYPINGQSVVYVLFDAANVPCYVGSTKNFKNRLEAHDRAGKRFVHFVAYPCMDRESAYAMEVRLLKEHKPYLNRKTAR